MPPKRTATNTPTTPMTDAQIKELIARGVIDALAKRNEDRSMNGDDNHDSWGDGRRQMHDARECTYTDFLKCQPMNFKGTKELELMCGRMFLEEPNKVEKYVGGLPNMIHGSKQNVTRTYSARSSKKEEYVRTLSVCNKCKLHYNGPCTAKYANCKRVGHLTQDCQSPIATNNQRILTYYECRNLGHYMSDCLELKNQNHGNQARGTEAREMVYALGGGENDQDLDDMEDDINS
uniref:Reverse transcriptase domain-containing protein n=1 Tax=Tanacetum cinerariifolium TaxID=118510 RepID=A0A6L2LUK4_TANCI|nr:reverse transcriptase domain-containing protein [Tanacetum cinerariifolium]